MTKKCIICEDPAVYKIKDINDFYCEECAQDHFSDISMLLKVEEEAKLLKAAIEKKMAEQEDDGVDIVIIESNSDVNTATE